MAAYLAATPGRGKAFVYDVVDDDGDDAEIRVAASDRLQACPFDQVVRAESRFVLYSVEGDLVVFVEIADKAALWGGAPLEAATARRRADGGRLVVAAVATALEWAAGADAWRPHAEGRVAVVLSACDSVAGLHGALVACGATASREPRWCRALLATSAAATRDVFADRLAACLALDVWLAPEADRYVLIASDASRRCADVFRRRPTTGSTREPVFIP